MLDVKRIQARLRSLGFYKGSVDGILGPQTEKAIVAFKVKHGLAARPYIGPQTEALLFKDSPQKVSAAPVPNLPWMNELAKHLHLHERNNFQKLYDWLRSDGATLGDPRKFPWCGDAIQTAIKLTLPNEPFEGPLAINPYLARNWLHFGYDCGPRYGAIAVFWRGDPKGMSGHVCTAIGYDPKLKRIRCRGGNQSDSISDTWLDEGRLLGFRAPRTYAFKLPPLPTMDSSGSVVSTNEA